MRSLGRAVLLGLVLPHLGPLSAQEVRKFALLTVNDVYRIEGLVTTNEGGLARLATVRRDLEADYPDLITLHAGDLLSPSLMSRLYDGEQMVRTMNVLDRDPVRFDSRLFVTFGNHEFDEKDPEDAAALSDQLARSQFTWLDAGVDFERFVEYEVGVGRDRRTVTVDGVSARILPNFRRRALVSAGGVWIGIFGLTLPVDNVAYVNSFLWTAAQRREHARRATGALRRAGAEFVIGLTHLPLPADLALLRELGPDGPDLIVGGHEHGRVVEKVGGRYVTKADADARTANLIEVTISDREFPVVGVASRSLDRSVTPEPQVADTVDRWVRRHNREFCAALSPPQGDTCLDQPLARIEGQLVAEEMEIRSRETALGQWVAEAMLRAMSAAGGRPDAAVINSGALRLNQNVADGANFTRRHLEELIEYDDDLHEVEVTGRELQDIMEISARCIGSGPWLQVAGVSGRLDPQKRRIAGIQVGGQAIDPRGSYRIVVPNYLAGGGDGYTTLAGKPRITTVSSLKGILTSVLAALPNDRLILRPSPALTSVELPGPPADPCPNP